MPEENAKLIGHYVILARKNAADADRWSRYAAARAQADDLARQGWLANEAECVGLREKLTAARLHEAEQQATIDRLTEEVETLKRREQPKLRMPPPAEFGIPQPPKAAEFREITWDDLDKLTRGRLEVPLGDDS